MLNTFIIYQTQLGTKLVNKDGFMEQNDLVLQQLMELNQKVGCLQATADDTKLGVEDLNTKVAIQNGRVAKIEGWQKFMKGGLAVVSFLILAIATILGFK